MRESLMANKKEAENGNMSAERKRLIALSDELLGLTAAPAMKTIASTPAASMKPFGTATSASNGLTGLCGM